MYPKVKVRTDDPDDRRAVHEPNWSSLLSFKDIPFLSSQDSCFLVKGHLDVSPSATARIPESYVPSTIMPTVSASEVLADDSISLAIADKKSDFDDQEDRPNIRTSSVPRPRAVLSSPDNDAAFGNKNREAMRPSSLRSRKLIQSRHAKCKVIPSPDTDEQPLSTRTSKDIADTKSDLKGKKGSMMPVSNRRKIITTDRQSSTRI